MILGSRSSDWIGPVGGQRKFGDGWDSEEVGLAQKSGLRTQDRKMFMQQAKEKVVGGKRCSSRACFVPGCKTRGDGPVAVGMYKLDWMCRVQNADAWRQAEWMRTFKSGQARHHRKFTLQRISSSTHWLPGIPPSNGS